MKDEKDEQNGLSNFQSGTEWNPERGMSATDPLDEIMASESFPEPRGEDDEEAIEEEDDDVLEDDDDEEEYEDEDDDLEGDGDNDVIGDDDDDAHTGERGSRKDPNASLF